MKFLKLFEDIDTKNGLYRLPEDHANEIKDILSGIADEGYEYHVTIYTPHGIKIESDEVCYFLLVHYLDIDPVEVESKLSWLGPEMNDIKSKLKLLGKVSLRHFTFSDSYIDAEEGVTKENPLGLYSCYITWLIIVKN